jgi:two-component system LytT family sensor kinase
MNPLSAGNYAVLGHGSVLLNMAGHCAGALIFGIFLFLLARDRAGSRLRGSRLIFAAGGLAFAWNLGALLLLATPLGTSELGRIVELLSFCSLTMLAPVLLHISLNHRCPLAFAGYLMGAVAVGLHVSEVVLHLPEFHLYALSLMAVGLGVVTLISAIHLLRMRGSTRQGLLRQMLGAGVLFVFIGTYVHVGLAQGASAWPQELVLHHASVPLALFIILHNHRFVLLDALIRFCANAALAAVFALAGLRLFRADLHALFAATDVATQLLRVIGIGLLLVLFALARDRLQRLLTRLVFRRGDVLAASQRLRSGAAQLQEELAYLPWALDYIAGFMRAERAGTIPGELAAGLLSSHVTAPALATDLPELRKALDALSAEVVVPLRFSETEVSFLLLGRRRGGQPYLSEDLKHLGQFGTIVADQVRTFRESELRRLAVRAELRALQAQINPHFLFNALNTVYGLVPRQAAEARQTVLNLADIFRYFLKDEHTTIPLEEELRIVEAYLQIETLRLGGKLRKEIQVDPRALRIPIPILSVQPLVENAVKHGIAPHPAGGSVRLVARLAASGLHILVADSGAGLGTADADSKAGAGMGLQNVARRLTLTYGPGADLKIDSGPAGTIVSFTVPVAEAAAAPV